MSEMLGNYYFLVQNYSDAIVEYEQVLAKGSDNSSLKRKYIICFIKQGRYKEALNIFSKIISRTDLDFFSSSIQNENTICRQLITELENFKNPKGKTETNYILGILWSFCDQDKAIKFFNKTREKDENFIIIKKIFKKFNHKNNHWRKKWKTNRSQEKTF